MKLFYSIFSLIFLILISCSNSDNDSLSGPIEKNYKPSWHIQITSNAPHDSLILGNNIEFYLKLDSISSDKIDSLMVDFNGDGKWEVNLPKFIDKFNFYIYTEEGVYNVICAAFDSIGWVYDTLKLTVYQQILQSNNKPIINLKGLPFFTIEQNSSLVITPDDENLGYSAFDAEEGDLTDKVQIEIRNKFNTVIPIDLATQDTGTYTITYIVYDSLGAYDKKTKTLKVIPINTFLPEIIIKDTTTQLIVIDSNFTTFVDTLLIIDEKYGTESTKHLTVKILNRNKSPIDIEPDSIFNLQYNQFFVIVSSNKLYEKLDNGYYLIEYSLTNDDNLSAIPKYREIVIVKE